LPAIAYFGSVNGNGAEPEVKNSFENVTGDAVVIFPVEAAEYVLWPGQSAPCDACVNKRRCSNHHSRLLLGEIQTSRSSACHFTVLTTHPDILFPRATLPCNRNTSLLTGE
jgi:hypothetical protein